MNLSILGRRRNAKRAPGPGTATRAGATLFDQPGSEAQTTMLPAPGPATDVSGPRTDTMPKIPALPQRQPAAPHEVAFGEWDTEAARSEAAAIFGPDQHGVATTETLDAIRAQVAAGSRDVPGDRYGDLTRSDLPPSMARAYASQDPEQTRFEPVVSTPQVAARPPVSAAESARAMQLLAYPEPGTATREEYAATMRRVDAATMTSSPYGQPAAWPMLPAAPQEAPVLVHTAGSGLPIQLAIEAPKKVAA